MEYIGHLFKHFNTTRVATIPLPSDDRSLVDEKLANWYSIFEFYYEKTKPVMVCSILSAGLNIFLNYLFIPQYGYLAAGYTTLVCYLFNSIMHTFVLRRIETTQGCAGVNVKGSFGIGILLIIASICITCLCKKSKIWVGTKRKTWQI